MQSVIEGRSAAQFLSGRFGALVLLLAYQGLLGRILPPTEYAAYAFTLAWCGLGQTLLGLGAPRVFSRFLSRVGPGVAPQAALTLLVAATGVRLAGGGVAGAAALLLTATAWPGASPYAWAGAAWGAFGLLQFDLDAAAQALGLQRAARRAALGEPLLRLGVTAAAAGAGGATALSMLWVGAATAAAASILLFAAAMVHLRSLRADGGGPIDWRAVRRTALGGHAGALAWALSSPPVVRLLARAVLSTEAFAGFSFAQALVTSLQRYLPSFMLFPLLEPAVMAEPGAGGVFGRLKGVLSLLLKLDALAVGVGIAASAAGYTLLPLFAHGRYGEAAPFLPWLLALVAISGAHRAYEVALIAVGAPEVLGRVLLVSLGWIVIAILGTRWFGLCALLLWPLGEALSRFSIMQRALDQEGLRDLLDLRRLVRIGVAAFMTAGAAWSSVRLLTGGVGVFGGAWVAGAAAIAFLISCVVWTPFKGADVRLIRSAIQRLFARSHAARPLRVVVLTPRGQGGAGGVDRLMDSLRPHLAAMPDVRVRFLTTRGPWRWCSPAATALALARFGFWFAREGIDVVHVNLGVGASFARKSLFAGFCRHLGLAYVVHVHGSGFDRFWEGASTTRRARIARLFEGAGLVLVLGRRWREMVTEHAPSVVGRLVILPNAAQAIVRGGEQPGDHDGPSRLLFLGEIGERKGVSILIEALARLPKTPEWRATIAGEGDASPYVAAASHAGLISQITFPGRLAPDQVKRALATADILVLPSFEENLPLSIIEAMGAGLAIVATPVGAVPDLIRDGETGLLVPVGDPHGLTEALSRLLRDGTLRRRLGDAAKARHSENFSLDAYAPTLAALWKRVLDL